MFAKAMSAHSHESEIRIIKRPLEDILCVLQGLKAAGSLDCDACVRNADYPMMV